MTEQEFTMAREMQCPVGHAFRITGNPKTGAPVDFYTFCSSGEWKMETKKLMVMLQEYTTERLAEYSKGLELNLQGPQKVVVNSRLELYPLYRILWDPLQMQWYGYGDPLEAVKQRLAKPNKTYVPRDRHRQDHTDQEE